MLFKREFSELMVMVDPKLHRKYATYDSKGNVMLYVETNKALCVLLQSALLLYNTLRKGLEDYSFVINTYDLCVTNAIIESYQMTVTWNVDDLKVSQKYPYQMHGI